MSFIANKMIVSWRSFALSVLLCIVVGLSSLAEPLDMIVDLAVGRMGSRPVTGEIVMVGLDDRTLGSVPGGRFSRADHARVIQAIDKAGARRLVVDFYYQEQQRDRDTPRLTSAIRGMDDRIILAVSTKSVPGTDKVLSIFPDPEVAGEARQERLQSVTRPIAALATPPNPLHRRF